MEDTKKKYQIYRVKDQTDDNVVDKPDLFTIPFRIALCGRSGAGKATLLTNLVGHPDYYGDDFDGDNIYIISGSLENDEKIKKLVKLKRIPGMNTRSSRRRMSKSCMKRSRKTLPRRETRTA